MNAKFFTFIIFCISCEAENSPSLISNSNDKFELESSLLIEAGYICGYGSGQDTIKIWNSTVRYVYYVPNKSPEPLVIMTRKLTETEWYEVLSSVDLNKFRSLKYNSSNISVNGCDEWIKISDNEVSHSIRFSKDLEIEGIKELHDILVKFRSEIN